MTTKTKKSNKSVARSQRTGDERATNAQRTRDERATIRTLFVPIMQKFRGYLKKDVANAPQIWMPIECNLLFRYEFAACSLQTRYLFVAIVLYCGARGTDEIPVDIRFLANALNADARTIGKSLEELEKFGLLLERKKDRGFEREEFKDTDRQTESAGARVCVDDSNLSKTKAENQSSLSNGNPPRDVFNENGNHSNESLIDVDARRVAGSINTSTHQSINQSTTRTSEPTGRGKHSEFSIEECLRYVEVCQSKGERVQSPKALARNLFDTGSSDAFIMQTLYPERAEEREAKQFGAPIRFTTNPCATCFGAKLADTDGKGYRACPNCKNERGMTTGYEPEQGETQ